MTSFDSHFRAGSHDTIEAVHSPERTTDLLTPRAHCVLCGCAGDRGLSFQHRERLSNAYLRNADVVR